MGDFGLVREALRERELLLTRLAPHLVSPVPFLWPLRRRGWSARTSAPAWSCTTRSAARARSRVTVTCRGGVRCAERPGLSGDGVVGGVQFYDAAEDDARMAVVVARTAAAHGAKVATRVRVGRLLRSGGGVVGADVLDEETRRVAAGPRAGTWCWPPAPWTDGLRAPLGAAIRRTGCGPSKGVHVDGRARPDPDGDRRARADREERPVHDPDRGTAG